MRELAVRQENGQAGDAGGRITAYVDDQNTALWIRSNESTDHETSRLG
ncbi:MAG: hypothetical protein OJF51_000134 [Nitrospira sp.]|nr:MAG: hypothetical protein OJF51_000134 [Nitrospira sp.]